MLAYIVRTLRNTVVVLSLALSFVAADEPATRYFDGAAREIVSSLEAGNGWAIVANRQNIEAGDGLGVPVDSVRYRIVTKFEKGTTSNDQFYVELQLSEATPWIFTVFKTPTASGPSLFAAKKANEAVALIDESIPLLEAAQAAEENAEVRALGNKVLAMYRTQRAALVNLIQKDIQAIR